MFSPGSLGDPKSIMTFFSLASSNGKRRPETWNSKRLDVYLHIAGGGGLFVLAIASRILISVITKWL